MKKKTTSKIKIKLLYNLKKKKSRSSMYNQS